MPSSTGSFSKAKSVSSLLTTMLGWKYSIVPDIVVPTGTFGFGDLTGANSGFFVFVCPDDMIFLGYQHIHATAGTNTLRVKKVLSATVGAAGAAVAAGHVDMSGTIALTGAANTVFTASPVITDGANRLAAGDKIAIASAAGTATLAGARGFLRLAFA